MSEYRPGRTTLYEAPSRLGGWLLYGLLGICVGGALVAAAYYAGRRAASAGNPVETAGATDAGQARLSSLFSTESGVLEGVRLLEAGDVDGAIRWFDDYLAGGLGRPRADEVLFHLGSAWEKKGAAEHAVACYLRLATDAPGSRWTASGLMRLAGITGNETEREKLLEALWRKFPGTPEGRRAALICAYLAYGRYCGADPQYARWEEVRDTYSLALEGLGRQDAERAQVVERLERLNDAIFYDPAILPRGGFWVRVHPGDSIASIAERTGTDAGSVKRLNGLAGDVIRPGEQLKVLRISARIVVERASCTLALYINGFFFKEYAIGIGRENLTPAGRFVIRSKVKQPAWYRSGEIIPYGDPRNILGTRWLGFERTGRARGLGIHGTSDAASIPGTVSEGCLRMLTPDVEEVFDLIPIGTEVVIL